MINVVIFLVIVIVLAIDTRDWGTTFFWFGVALAVGNLLSAVNAYVDWEIKQEQKKEEKK